MPHRKHSNIHNLDLMPSIYSSDSIAKEAYLHAYSILMPDILCYSYIYRNIWKLNSCRSLHGDFIDSL